MIEETLLIKIINLVPDLVLTTLVIMLTFRHDKRMDKKDELVSATHKMCEERLSEITNKCIETIEQNTEVHSKVLSGIDEIKREMSMMRR